MRVPKSILTLLLLAFASTSLAQNATLVVAPTRLTIKPGQRTAEAAVTNVSDKPLRYKLEVIDQIMTPSGTTALSENAPYSAKGMLRFMPAVINLKGGERQTIRFLVTRPAGLENGDYHSHVLFNEIVSAPEKTSTTEARTSGVSMEVGMSYAMAIPVIVQQGVVSSSAVLGSASLLRNAQGKATAVQATFHRHGNAEAVAKIEGDIAGVPAFTTRKVRLYREVDSVTVTLPLSPEVLEKNPQSVTIRIMPEDTRNTAPLVERVIQ